MDAYWRTVNEDKARYLSIVTFRCYDGNSCKSKKVPLCPECQSVARPDIVFFGESLPKRFLEMRTQDFKECDLLIVAGKTKPYEYVLCTNMEKKGLPYWCIRLLGSQMKFPQSRLGCY